MKTHLILDIGYLTEQNSDAWERETKEMSSKIAPTYCLEKISRPEYRKEEPKILPESRQS